MPEYLKALIVVLIIAAVVFRLASAVVEPSGKGVTQNLRGWVAGVQACSAVPYMRGQGSASRPYYGIDGGGSRQSDSPRLRKCTHWRAVRWFRSGFGSIGCPHRCCGALIEHRTCSVEQIGIARGSHVTSGFRCCTATFSCGESNVSFGPPGCGSAEPLTRH